MDNNGNLGKYSWTYKSALIRLFGPCRRIRINHRSADNYQHLQCGFQVLFAFAQYGLP